MHLSISGAVPGVSADEFETIIKGADKNCLISKVLNVPISLEAHCCFTEVRMLPIKP
ncbi:organic hydroperoxide reductase OsmC/OhrA [Pedobacter sp. W3I1]|nr:organic hydroperoxide reductase OsmC/OhrA [Pedobacter sp. W3I1]